MKNISLIFGVLILLVLIFLTWRFNTFQGIIKKTATVEIQNKVFQVDVAETEKQKQVGLSEKSTMADNRGMLFLFKEPGFYTFWMKKMQLPIDIIYIKDNKIVTIFKNISPPQDKNTPDEKLPLFTPKQQADKVLEINAGLSDQYKIKEGDSVKISL